MSLSGQCKNSGILMQQILKARKSETDNRKLANRKQYSKTEEKLCKCGHEQARTVRLTGWKQEQRMNEGDKFGWSLACLINHGVV